MRRPVTSCVAVATYPATSGSRSSQIARRPIGLPRLADSTAEQFTSSVTGLDATHPLYALVLAEVVAAKAE